MKLVLFGFTIFLFSCASITDITSSLNTKLDSNQNNSVDLTNEEVIKGLKEALNVGISNAVSLSSVTDGFLKNSAICLPFPPDAIKVREKAINLGLKSQVETFEETMNRAAEEASKNALPIFIEAIKNMSVSDGFTILRGGDGAATSFLKSGTSEQLKVAFLPVVKDATTKVKLTAYWNPIISKYNTAMTISGGQKLNPDLDAYITQKAIDGLFYLVEIEENKIRKDPVARVTDILVKVFGSLF